MLPENMTGDWWSEFLHELSTEDPCASEQVIVAEVGNRWNARSSRQVYTALIAPDQVTAALRHPGGIGYRVDTSGLHPSPVLSGSDRKYLPKFWIWAGEVAPDGLEPLVVAWTSGVQTTLAPDQGFLMTYGLVPRSVSNRDTFEIHWDDPTTPRRAVVIVQPVSISNYPEVTPAFVTMHRDYLRDYATLRGYSLIQVYYAERWGALTEEVAKTLGAEQGCAFDLPGRRIALHRVSGIEPEVVAKVWGVRHLCDPGDFPVSGGRWDYGSLLWPGMPEPLTDDQAMRMGLIEVFVTDTVLAMYEGRPEFRIFPEQGAVSYGSQWSVGYTRRIGRDLIAVELRKLYEGAPPDVVRHWHRHAVALPVGDLATHRDVPNVGTRARRVVYALVRSGEALASIASAALNAPVTASETVGLVRHDLDQQGWWMAPHVEPITRHIPLTLTEDGFLSRCGALHRLVIEGLNEGIIRRTLLKLGFPEDKIRDFRSVRLLDRLLQYALIAIKSGLDPVRHADEIASRLESLQLQIPISILFTLNDLRIVESHRGDKSRTEKIDLALRVLRIDRRVLAPGWGIAIDSLYDVLGESLEQSASILEAVLRQIQH